jgi:hypothetical protein
VNTHGPPLTLATLCEPGAHGIGQALGLHPETRFDEAFGKRKRVIELSFAGKVSHTKIVKPIEGTGAALDTYHDFDAQLPSVHEASIAYGRTQRPRRTPNSLLLLNQRTRIEFVPDRVAWRPSSP